MESFKIYFLFFIFYSFIGWIMEVICVLYCDKKLVNRGFLIGPYCPIYGLGALLMTIFLQGAKDKPVLVFFLALLICSSLEYLTSYILEKIFHARWWDYSKKKFNLNGRICLNTMIPFGSLGVVMIYLINPFILKLYTSFDPKVVSIVMYVLMAIFVIDMVISITVLISVKKDVKLLVKDNTEEMRKKVIEKLKSHGILFKRLFMSFPNFRYIGTIIKEKTKSVKNKIVKKKVKKDEK